MHNFKHNLFYSESLTGFESSKMAQFCFDAENPLNCPICLNLLTDPVTTSCGHSYCMDCIERSWDQEVYRGVYSCPKCRTKFNQRPTLSRSTVLAEIVDGMNQEDPAGPEDVQCDVCKGRKLKAIKSCLVCLASYCQSHIQPHYESEAFRKHKLVNASSNLQQQICPQHHKALEIFCQDDQKCICVVCLGDQHSGHKAVSAADEMDKKQEELKIKQKDFMQEAKDREKRVQTLKKAVESHKAAVQHSERIFDELISSIQKRQAEMREKISAQEKEVQEVENHIQTLEQEIRTLQKDNDTLEPLLHTEDHIHFFQNYPSCSEFLSYTILLKDFNNLLTTENVNKSLSELKGQLDKICEEHMGRKSVGDILKSKIVSVSRRRATVREVEGHPLYITTRSSEHHQSDIRARPSERHQSDIRTRSLERHQSDIRPRSSGKHLHFERLNSFDYEYMLCLVMCEVFFLFVCFVFVCFFFIYILLYCC
ncbi:tripartite motif-containing protein 29-like isoform X1 [Cyprinus carpio]|uniref:Tripartite motif-containing protein 29-like isoform X1 n=1 Tax=Cyprinus carpio TaxID=7962 RepID=A0A9R0B8F9_CYPCA|nr:tripartite motif-containing protein 29-like isoform X1 [Cyprinus carpio]